MPELAEVAFYAKQWDVARGCKVKRVELHVASRVFRGGDAEGLEAALRGSRLELVLTHGKQMLFGFSGGRWLRMHLGMTGELTVRAEPFGPGRHDHLVLHTAACALVFTDPRQFGQVLLQESRGLPDAWVALPPQPMEEAFTLEHLSGILQRHARQPLKALLLDQQHFPGIGNWMADEVLWQMRLHPQTPAGAADRAQQERLLQVLRKVCRVALDTIGVDWSDPPRSWLFQHRWEAGHVCPRCRTPLERGGLRGRTACWCPRCQGR